MATASYQTNLTDEICLYPARVAQSVGPKSECCPGRATQPDLEVFFGPRLVPNVALTGRQGPSRKCEKLREAVRTKFWSGYRQLHLHGAFDPEPYNLSTKAALRLHLHLKSIHYSELAFCQAVTFVKPHTV